MPKVRLAILLSGIALGLSACSYASSATDNPDNWVVIHFANSDDYMAGDAVELLLDTEVAADEALQDAGAGFIDGNEVGDYGYDLYFVGEDPTAMWAIIERIFEVAPMKWSSVELRHGLEDQNPQVISPSIE